jgi:hypothetical protein
MSRKLSGNINPNEEYKIVIPNDAPTSLKKRLRAINKIIEDYDDLIFHL